MMQKHSLLRMVNQALQAKSQPMSFGGDYGPPKLLFNLKAHNDLIQSLSFSPDGKLLASCSYDRLVKIWSIPEGKLIQELKDHSDSVYAVAFNKDGSMLASTGADRAIKVWDTKTWKKLHALSDSTDWVYTLAWSPVKNQLLGAGLIKPFESGPLKRFLKAYCICLCPYLGRYQGCMDFGWN